MTNSILLLVEKDDPIRHKVVFRYLYQINTKGELKMNLTDTKNVLISINNVNGYTDVNGTVYLNLEAVARGLGFVDNTKNTEYVKWDRVNKYLNEIGFSTQVSKGDFIPENIFYRLCMKAKNATAEKFQAWVADEVIPAIRKTGSYALNNNANSPSYVAVLSELKDLRKQFKILSEQNKIIVSYMANLQLSNDSCSCQHDRITPQVQSNSDRFPLDEILDELRDSHVEHLGVGQLADIWREHGVDVDEISLFQWLRNESYLIRGGIKYNQPRKKYLQNGWFETKRYYRCGKAYNKPLLTVSGQIAITKAYYTDRA